MPFDIAALAEPMGCVLNGVKAVGTDGVAQARVFGAGPIGWLMAIALQTRGVSDIHVVDIAEDRLSLAESFGFQPVAAGSDALAAMRHQMDLSIDATGVATVAGGLVDYTVNGGRVLFFGVCPPDATIQIHPFEVFRRQLILAGAHSLNHNIPEALAAIAAYGSQIARLVSHHVPLADMPAVLDHRGPANGLKIQAVWD